jgi:hypothetical protein
MPGIHYVCATELKQNENGEGLKKFSENTLFLQYNYMIMLSIAYNKSLFT